MSRFEPEKGELHSLEGKVVVVTGGSNGIGAALVSLLARTHGAYVVFGDLDTASGSALAESLSSPSSPSSSPSPQSTTPPSPSPQKKKVLFRGTDVRSHKDLLSLFTLALSTHGIIHHAVAAAGSNHEGIWFAPHMGMADIQSAPGEGDMLALETNLIGTLLFVRLACVFLREGRDGSGVRHRAGAGGGGEMKVGREAVHEPSPSPCTENRDGDGDGDGDGDADRSLVLLSSIAALTPAPGLPLYSTSKHGVQGLLRSLAPFSLPRLGIRVNAVNPWMTLTAMTRGIENDWKAAGLPVNTPRDVARVVVGLMKAGGKKGGDGENGENKVNGRGVYVEGGRGWEVEGYLTGKEGIGGWMGEKGEREWRRGQGVLGMGDKWASKGSNTSVFDEKKKVGDGTPKL